MLVYKAFSGEMAKEIALLVGTVYPFFKSVQALQTDTDPEDDTTWLTYWMCYGCFTVADMHVGFLLEIIPFYYTLKLALFIWLQLPLGDAMGAKLIYRLSPMLVTFAFSLPPCDHQGRGFSCFLLAPFGLPMH